MPKHIKYELFFSENEALSMMYSNTANTLKRIADYVEKHQVDSEGIIAYLREIADEHEAQNVVIGLREKLKKMV